LPVRQPGWSTYLAHSDIFCPMQFENTKTNGPPSSEVSQRNRSVTAVIVAGYGFVTLVTLVTPFWKKQKQNRKPVGNRFIGVFCH
jgi:hypothetical protein